MFTNSSRTKVARLVLAAAAITAPAIGVFSPVLFTDRTFAFRDAAHFYPPLWRLTRDEWSAGRVPLWNPYENLGQPLLAQPAAAVCYPAQALFLLPLPFAWTQKAYIVGHVFLAAGAAYGLARSFRASVAGAGMCAVAYAFSGNVLMQHTNPPFLVGAAWLPVAVLCVDRIARLVVCGGTSQAGAVFEKKIGDRSPAERETGNMDRLVSGRNGALAPAARWSLGLAVVLALMVLGGDPQMAYNVGLIAALYTAVALGNRGRAKEPRQPRFTRLRSSFACVVRALCWFGGAALIAGVLSAVQVLPSWQFTARSNRTPPPWRDRLTAKLQPGSHHEHVYQFSVGPWRLGEALWPNVSGRQYPLHRRWLDVLPAEGRVWTPTLYMGTLPLVLGLVAMRFRRGPSRHRWLSWLALLSTLAGFGYYGLGWLLAEFGIDTGLGGPFGGLYWLMTLLLPGYVQFRYPAKLLIPASLALSLLAACAWTRDSSGDGRRARRLLAGLGGLSLLGLGGAVAVRPFWTDWMAAVPADQLFGPFDASGAWRDLAAAFAQTALLCVVFGWLLYIRARRITGGWGRRAVAAAPCLTLLLVAADVAGSNAWLVATAPRDVAVGPSRFGRRVTAAGAHPASDGPAPVRTWRHPIWMPEAWRENTSADRLTELMRFDRDTLWPNYNFDMRICMTEVHGTMMLRDYARFLAFSRRVNGEAEVTVFDLAAYAVLPPAKTIPGRWQTVDCVPGAVLWRNMRPWPRAWIARPNVAGRPRNIQGESCRIVHYDPQRVVIDVTLLRPGLVVLAEQFYPGWHLQVSSATAGRRAVTLRQDNDAMRAAELPAGRHRLTFRFRPWIVYVAAAVSAAGWLGLTGWIGWGCAANSYGLKLPRTTRKGRC